MKLADSWLDIEKIERGFASPPTVLPKILEDVSGFLSRYIVFSSEAQAIVVTLWVAHTWVIEALDYTPYLHISSPVKQCGKSRVFDCLRLLCAKPWPVVSITEAVLFRKIERDAPTLLLDEVDAIFSAKGDDTKEALRALLNAGFERRATVPRCVGPLHTLTEFGVFCAKALAGIGKLPDTVADRCIPIVMTRRAPGQLIEKFRMRDAEAIAEPIQASLRAWGEDPAILANLRGARPHMPDNLGDRAADICEPLLAIADMAGGAWPETVRSAIVELCAGSVEDETTGVKLLAAVREIFEARAEDQISTKDLLDALISRENDEPWPVWWEPEIARGNTRGPAGKLARYLKPFGIVSGTIREAGGNTPKGYKLASFQDAFLRYLRVKTPQ